VPGLIEKLPDGEFGALLDRSFSSAVQTQPRWWHDPACNQPTQPVVGVCWHEARAYCAWLSAQTGQDYRVPSEVEWEVAARGQAARRYPWEGDFDPGRCNSFESHVRGTTPVGVFPDGDTPQGIADMSGNVCEWTGSLYRPYPYRADDGRENSKDGDGRRVVRGGSWRHYRERARCAYRYHTHPGDRGLDLGFRVLCVSHIEQSFASAAGYIGAGEAPQGAPEMSCDHGCAAEAKELWMARASPVRTAIRPSGAY